MYSKAKALIMPLTLLIMFMLQGCDATPPQRNLDVAKANAEQCAISDDISEVRKNHMEYILDQRDKTMHQGIRTKQFSFKECINCHIPAEENGKPVRYGDKNHFCSTCHEYVSVTLDCFECHSDRPEGAATSAATAHASLGGSRSVATGDIAGMLSKGDTTHE
jgi:hypothetical protein